MAPRPPGPLPPGRSRDELLTAVAEALDHLEASANVVVACSGGPDSTALAFLVAEARPDLVLVLAHVSHGLRDDADDRAVVVQHASWLGASVERRDVEVVRAGHGIEAAARDARYRALRSVAAQVDATAILVGHTADDQAETVLFRLVRGTGVDGLRGMDTVSGDLIRPLLRIRRTDVHSFVREEGLPSSVDPTNVDRRLRRAVIRHDVLPHLANAAPDAVGALVRLADLARSDVDALEAIVAPLLGDVRWFGPLAAVPTELLDGAPIAVRRRLLRAVIRRLIGAASTAASVERIVSASEGFSATLPGSMEFAIAGGWCIVARRPPPEGPPSPLAVHGFTTWRPAGISIEARGAEETPPGDPGPDEAQYALPLPGVASPTPRLDPRLVPPGGRAERCVILLPAASGPLVVRHALPGDRLRTAVGRRTVADVLGEARMPRGLRRVWPVVAAGERIVWVPAVAADHEWLLDGLERPALRLILRRGRGPRTPEG